MSKSPFDAIHAVITEPSNTFDVVRIIAKDARGLDSADRESLRRAADELEQAQRLLILTQVALIEAQQRQIATGERLLELRKAIRFAALPFDRMGGSLVVSGYRIG
jgi:hypothetical protein